MFRTNNKETRKTGIFGKARKFVLGLGALAVAGTLMAATPAMARDRGDDRGRGPERREVRHDEIVRHDFVGPIVCDPIAPVVGQIWVPARYELETRYLHGHAFTERVLVEAGHYVCG